MDQGEFDGAMGDISDESARNRRSNGSGSYASDGSLSKQAMDDASEGSESKLLYKSILYLCKNSHVRQLTVSD
jgi:hypothetical protein